MSPYTMLSLVIFAFLIFMVVVLMYIKQAAEEEMNNVKLQMLIRFSVELCEEMYNLDEHEPEERVDKAVRMLEKVINDWDIELEYNTIKIKSKLRKLTK
jgi:hypothetical protein